MILAIDAGNSRLKWGLHDGDKWIFLEAVSYSEWDTVEAAWRVLVAPDKIVVSNVAGEKVKSSILALLELWDVNPCWIKSLDEECGVINSYAYGQLGCDRWAAMIAARHLHAGTCLVVSAGTAMTVDVVSDKGVFTGGIIVPGIQLMQHILSQQTAGVTQASAGNFAQFPKNTSDAVYSGALQAMAGAIERMSRSVSEEYGIVPLCVLSGGSAMVLKPLLEMPLLCVENLVLEGLLRIAYK